MSIKELVQMVGEVESRLRPAVQQPSWVPQRHQHGCTPYYNRPALENHSPQREGVAASCLALVCARHKMRQMPRNEQTVISDYNARHPAAELEPDLASIKDTRGRDSENALTTDGRPASACRRATPRAAGWTWRCQSQG